LKTAPIVAATPEHKEMGLTAAIQTTPVANSVLLRGWHDGRRADWHLRAQQRRHMPNTASALPLIVFMGLGSIAAAFV
jgi:hypothetical protein